MFITINLKDASNPDMHALYKLTSMAGELIHIGVVPYSQLTAFNDVPVTTYEYGDAFLSIVETGTDRLILANAGLSQTVDPILRERLTQTVQSWSNTATGNIIECIETGEKWPTAQACADAHDLTYGALLNHLKGTKSHNSVKGRTYRKATQ